jgi:hypothetical protein
VVLFGGHQLHIVVKLPEEGDIGRQVSLGRQSNCSCADTSSGTGEIG